MKYKILIDYGCEGRSYYGNSREGKDFKSIDEAVKIASQSNFGSEFQIVQVVEWEAKEKD
jgi:hypothetical protein